MEQGKPLLVSLVYIDFRKNLPDEDIIKSLLKIDYSPTQAAEMLMTWKSDEEVAKRNK